MFLDENITASKYILEFVIIELKLDKMSYVIPLATLRNKFLNQILNPDYNTIVQILRSKVPLVTLDEFINEIRKQEDQLERETREARSSTRVRRMDYKSKWEDKDDTPEPDSKWQCLTIPKCVTRQVKDGG